MDINRLFDFGMSRCGRVLNILPKNEIKSPREYMKKILLRDTLPSINTVYPRLYKTTIRVDALIPMNPHDEALTNLRGAGMDSRYSAFRIPKELTEGLGIVSIKSCVPSGTITDGTGMIDTNKCFTYPNKWGRFSSANMYEAVSRAQLAYADMMLMGNITAAFRYYFYTPNIIAFNKTFAKNGVASLTMTLCLENDENLISIPETAYEGIKRLFILDLKAAIYGEYQMHSEVDTPYGTLDLKIGDWSNCESERDDLYNSYSGSAHYRTTAMRTG